MSASRLTQSKSKSPSEVRLVEVLDAYMAAAQEGRAPARDELLAEHPELAEDLEACLASLEFIRQASLTATPLLADPKAAEISEGETGIGDLGDFRLIAEVGRGGMGVVYEAVQRSLNRRVALKVLPFAAAMDPTQLRRFQTEALAAAQLHHTHIVPVYSVGCERGVHYYAMQFIEGQTLAQAIAERGRMEETSPPPARRGSLDRARGGPEGLLLESRLQAESGPAKAGTPTLPGRGSPARADAVPEGLLLESRLEAESGPAKAGTPTPPGRGSPGTPSDPTGAPAETASGARRGSPGTRSDPPGAPAETADRRSPIPDESPTPRRSSGSAPSSRSREFFRTAAALGIQAAEALDHAHKVGIVHRDIKPANLLLDVHGSLWVTDFGLARLQDEAGLTITGDLLGTLRYMSPEQALAQRGYLDHRTDIYSLGATLYELVTLRPAIDGQDRHEVLRKIAQDEPTPPRRLNPSIPRELETILLKAMNKEPESRYDTAQELADDLRRSLEDKPIKARRPSLVERTIKWSRRHKPLVGSAISVLILAMISLVITTAVVWRERDKTKSAYQAEAAQRKLLATNLDLALKVLDEIYLDVAEKHLPSKSQMAPEDQKLLRKALAFYELFAAQNDTNPGTQFAATSAHGRVGDILRTLGEHAKAKEEYDRAIAGLSRLTEESPRVPGNQFRLAEVYGGLSLLLRHTGHPREAMEALREELAILQKLVDRFPEEAGYRYRQALTNLDVSLLLADDGLLREAEEAERHAVGVLERLVKEHPQERKYEASLSHAYNLLGSRVWTAGRNREAADAYRKSLAILVRLVGDNPSNTKDPENLAALYHNLSVVLGPAEMAAKEDYSRRAIRLREQLATDLPNVPDHRNWLANHYDHLGSLLNQQGHRQQANQASLRALEIREDLVQRFPEVPDYQASLGMALHNRAIFLTEPGEFVEARRLFERAIVHQRAALKSNPANPVWRQRLRNHYHGLLFQVLKCLGAHREAARAADELTRVSPIQWRDKLLAAHILIGCVSAAESDTRLSFPERESDARSYTDRSDKLLDDATGLIRADIQALKALASDLADCTELRRFRNPTRAIGLATKAIELAADDAQSWIILGVAYYRAGDAKAAIEAIEQSMQLSAGGDASGWFFLAMACWRKGDKEKARSWYDKAVQWMEKKPSQDEVPGLFPARRVAMSTPVSPLTGSQDEELRRFRAEAAALLGVTDHPKSTGKKEENGKERSRP